VLKELKHLVFIRSRFLETVKSKKPAGNKILKIAINVSNNQWAFVSHLKEKYVSDNQNLYQFLTKKKEKT
jgi:hypothetical protein